MNVEGLFRSKELREELIAHTIYGVDASPYIYKHRETTFFLIVAPYIL